MFATLISWLRLKPLIGFATLLFIASVATWKIQDWRYSGQIARLKLSAAQREIAATDAAVAALRKEIRITTADAADAYRAGSDLKNEVAGITEGLKNATSLPTDCHLDSQRMRALEDAIRAEVRATASP